MQRRTRNRRRSTRGMAAEALCLCILLACVGCSAQPSASPGIIASASAMPDAIDDISGCYAFDECLFMHPLSSFNANKETMPVVYGLDKDALIIADARTGDIDSLPAQYVRMSMAEGELSLEKDMGPAPFPFPDLSSFQQRWLRATFTDQIGRQLRLYCMDDETWLVTMGNGHLWSIYRLVRTQKTTLADLQRALAIRKSPEGGRQMTLLDVYALARKGQALSLQDLAPFDGKAVGSGFWIVRYDIQGGCVLLAQSDTPDSPLNYARLSKQGYDPFNPEGTVDIREGAQAVSDYLNPLNSLAAIEVEDPHIGPEGRDVFYEAYGYRYSLRSIRADKIFVTLADGERLPIKQALEEHRLTVEDAVAKGLGNVIMEPADGLISGYFPILHSPHTFAFDYVGFAPSVTFLFVAYEPLTSYFDIAELADTLDYQGKHDLAERLRQLQGTAKLTDIVGKSYISEADLEQAGITADVDWALSSHTPVRFVTTEQ